MFLDIAVAETQWQILDSRSDEDMSETLRVHSCESV